MLYKDLSYNTGVEMLRTETQFLIRKGIDFSCYDVRIPGYVVLFSNVNIPEIKDYGYEELTEEEREVYKLNGYEKYKKKKGYKVPIEVLLNRLKESKNN